MLVIGGLTAQSFRIPVTSSEKHPFNSSINVTPKKVFAVALEYAMVAIICHKRQRHCFFIAQDLCA